MATFRCTGIAAKQNFNTEICKFVKRYIHPVHWEFHHLKRRNIESLWLQAINARDRETSFVLDVMRVKFFRDVVIIFDPDEIF